MVDDVLPSYGQATTRDHWQIISSFVRSQDLCAAALVSREWNQIFIPHLWGNPASHFGKENDAVYVALVRFKRTLAWARLSTRELTHTLHFPPAQAELYDGPHSEWLYEILQRLPKLQSLIVSQLPFFDHGALSTLEDLSKPSLFNKGVSAMYSLRLLDASNCINITPKGLSEGLRRFPALMYLELSGTTSAKHPVVLSNLCHNPCLQILKLQRLALTDDELRTLAVAVGHNLRSLDVRDNRVTDRGIRDLIEQCIGRVGGTTNGLDRNGMGSPRRYSPSRSDFQMLDVFQTERQDEYIRSGLTGGFVNYVGLESASGSGITHLYITGNPVTVEGVSGLIRASKLHVLDAGTILPSIRHGSTTGISQSGKHMVLPGVEKLTPIIESSGKELTYLRINHAVVTLDVPAGKDIAEMEDSSTLIFPQNSVELDSTDQAVHELPDTYISELPGDIPIYAELEGSVVPPDGAVSKSSQAIHTGPEPRPPELVTALFSPLTDASGGLFSPVSPCTPGRHSPTSIPTISSTLAVPVDGTQRKRTYSGVIDEHEAQIKYRLLQPHSLLPSMLQNLQTLVLVDVPPKAFTPDVAKHIIQFITDCAEEAHWSKIQASVGYALPPGRDRRSAERSYARTLFPLRQLILEMAPEQATTRPMSGWRRPSNPSIALSSVLDPDCETLWDAAQNDFSFFGGEECGLPDGEGTRSVPLTALTEKMSIIPDEMDRGRVGDWKTPSKSDAPAFDVLAEISNFRRMKKVKYEAAVARGETNIYIEGYWEGEIVVIRPRR